MSNHFRPCYEFKTVPVKGRRYTYWYLRIPGVPGRSGKRWHSVYVGKVKPAESAAVLATRFRDSGPDSLNALLRKRRAAAG